MMYEKIGAKKMADVPITIVVDGESLKYAVEYNPNFQNSTPDKPVNIGAYGSQDKYVYMMTKNDFVVNDQAKSELTVKANPNNTIQWTMVTFSTDYTAFIYRGNFNPGDHLRYDGGSTVQVNTYLPANDEAPTGDRTKYKNEMYVVDALVKKSGKIQYSFCFVVVDNSNGNTIGWFTWDPFINVS